MRKKYYSELLLIILTWMFVLCFFFLISVRAIAAGTGSVSISSVNISGQNVIINVFSREVPYSDDGLYYLFSEKVYQNTIDGAPLTYEAIDENVTFTIPLESKTTKCHLYEKFRVAVKQRGEYIPVTGARYITNPEALAYDTPERRRNKGKKGLILDGAKIGNGNIEAPMLGVQQGAYNINLTEVIGGDCVVRYDYNGKTYYFDSAFMNRYDHCIKTCNKQGMGVTMVLLVPYEEGKEFLISPSARDGIGGSYYYLMNTSDDEGLEYLAATVSYLALRYNGTGGFGQVDNWVIANEVNAKKVWNYSWVEDELAYAKLYSDSLRVCYTAIKSRNANAYVCISLDHNWNHIDNSNYYSARSMLNSINHCISAEGNIDWALAEHPYNYPMTWTKFWRPELEGMITHRFDTPYISMENIEQLTDYMCQPYLLNTKGAVRPILLTEVGYTSTQGEEAQAAAIVYAYYRSVTNKYITFIVFNRQTDHPLEVSQGLAVGLTYQSGKHKLAYEYYRNMNGSNSVKYIEKAAAYMGIEDWDAQMYPR